MKKNLFLSFVVSIIFATQLDAQDKKVSPQQTNVTFDETNLFYKKKTNTEQIYIIDGVQSIQTTENSSPLNSINPNDIESIDVIKGAVVSAIYGAKVNGVLFVTTKKGERKVDKEDKKALATLINIAPNPSKDAFNVNLGTLEINGATLRVYNVEGKVVFNSQITTKQQTISLENMPKG